MLVVTPDSSDLLAEFRTWLSIMTELIDEYSRQGSIDSPPPSVLFKFRRFPSLEGLDGGRLDDAKWQREEVFNVLRGFLRLAKPDSFNDPFEFRPAVKVVEGSSKHRAKSLRKYVMGAIRENLPWKRRIALLQNPAQVDRVAANLPTITTRSLAQMRNEIEIYCLSANETRPLLWSHYADGHRGVAINMDATRPPFQLSWKVHYLRDYPAVTAGGERSPNENWNRLRQSLLVKDADWSYEEEYRFLAPQSPESTKMLQRHGVFHENGYLQVSPSTAIGVTIGAKMPDDAKSDLIAFLNAKRPDVYIRHARLAEGRFEIEVDG